MFQNISIGNFQTSWSSCFGINLIIIINVIYKGLQFETLSRFRENTNKTDNENTFPHNVEGFVAKIHNQRQHFRIKKGKKGEKTEGGGEGKIWEKRR